MSGYSTCLAHLNESERDAYLAGLTSGADVDHRGTTLTAPLLQALFQALQNPTSGRPTFGVTRFDEAVFTDTTFLSKAKFTSVTIFKRAIFNGSIFFVESSFTEDTIFSEAKFNDSCIFTETEFTAGAFFGEVQFKKGAIFLQAAFNGAARFEKAVFSAHAGFSEAHFSGDVNFSGTRFAEDLSFSEAVFKSNSVIGPLICTETIDLCGAVFEEPLTLEAAAQEILCIRTQWRSTANLRLRHARLDLSRAVANQPVSVTAHFGPFSTALEVLDEASFPVYQSSVFVTSLQDVDAAQLLFTNINFSECWFSGAFHLDQVRLEGRCVFPSTPSGISFKYGFLPHWWTKRRTLPEEQLLRVQSYGSRPHPHGWEFPAVPNSLHALPEPDVIAGVYRQLRKTFEDAKNEPGAADFYYGEMEMRRHSWMETSRVERWLIAVYWALSGYGLRALRSLSWLALAMTTTILLMMGLGLPLESPKQTATGIVPVRGGKVTFEIDAESPKNPTHDRFTGKRFEKALSVTLNSVVFRSSGQDLTTTGGYIEMASRFSEPVLLGLAVLAVRGRVKR
ncbi:pentapeptide repeat-containing protein [Streptomyces sp. NPDC087856]|uniref:pentapeptide repeat-containing protein n=1 Tax=Streptomyces sp. NPDC087856 TaxID=3365811 RepID=UPI00381D79BE